MSRCDTQTAAEFDGINEALVGAVKALGGSKAVGAQLWPDLAPDQAQRKLLDCLNPERPAHLTPEQTVLVLRLARRKGYHAAVGWLLDELGYAPTTPVEPVDQVAELQRQFIEAAGVLAQLGERINALQQPAASAAPAGHGWVEGRTATLRAAA